MSLRLQMSTFSIAALMCTVAFAQVPGGAPGGAPGQSPSPQTGPGGMPGATPSTFPSTGNAPTAGPDGFNVNDKDFVKRAADRRATEIELGKLAQEKGSNDAVKQFGKRVVEDGSRTDQSLAAAAARVNVEVPSELPRSGKKTVDKLAKLSGPEFDRAFAKTMVSNQKDDVTSYSEEAQSGRVPEVKEFAAKSLPIVQEHRKMAEDLAADTKK